MRPDAPGRQVRRAAALAAGPLLALLAPLAGTAVAGGSPAPERPYAGTVDELVEQLREDPIVVQPSMAMGDSRRAHDVLAEAAEDVELPVYVVLADLPTDLRGTEGPAEQAAVLLRDALGDGLYHIEFLEGPAHTQAWGVLPDFGRRAVVEAIARAEAHGPGEYPRTSALFQAVLTVRSAAGPGYALPDSLVDEYAAQPWAFLPESGHNRADALAARWVAAIATGTGVLVAGTIIAIVAARRGPAPRRAPEERRPAHTPVPADARVRAERRLDAVRRRLAALTAEQLATGPAAAAGTALDAADRVLGTGDELDAVGAQVLAATADRDLDRVERPELPRYRPCFVNPLHGEAADGTVQVAGSSLDAPVCRDCARDQAPFLAVRRRLRGWVPYPDTSTVWAWTGFGSLVGDLAEQVLDDRSVRR